MPSRSHATVTLWILVALTFLIYPLSAAAQTSGVVAAYGFNETSGNTVTDISGNNNNGTLGSGVTRTATGKFGGALVFNGAGLVTIANSASLQLTTGMTLEAWVNPSAVTNAWRDVIYKGNDNYYLEATSDNGMRPGAGGTFGTTYGTGALAANTWTHLAVTYDRVTLRVYVNGLQVSSLAATGTIATSTNPLQIGGDSLYGQFFQGMIDEVRIYNRALTQAEIQTDMNTAVGGTPPTNTPPTITAIGAQVTNEDTATGAIGFTVGDAETAAGSLTVSGSSSNTTLVPNGNIVFGGSGANRTVTITPAANQSGTANITVTVSDGQLSTPTSFQLTVNAVNDAPTITSIGNQTTTSGTAVGPLNFTIGDVDTPLASLTVSGSSNNTTLVPNGNMVFGGSGGNRTVTVTPAAGQTGTTTITVTVSDGQLSTPTSFQLTVNGTNTPPTITSIAAQTTNEDIPTAAIGFTVGDAETAAGSLTVSGSSNNTTLVPNANIVFGGSGANRTVTITPAANQNGTATITVTVSDGQLSTPTSFQLTVNAVNDAPTITSIGNQTTTSGTAVGPLNFTIGDVETAAASLTVSGSSNNTALVPNGNMVFGGSGGNRTVTVTPAAGQTGTTTITVTVSDGQLSTPTSFQLTVNAAPSGGLVAAYGFNETSGNTVTDISGNNNNGTLGSGVTRTATGKFGGALVFNGAGLVTIANSASLQLTTGMTLEAWVNPSAVTNAWRDVIYKGNDNYYLEATSDNGMRPGAGGTFGTTYGTGALAANTWTHLAVTYDRVTLRVYVNGLQVSSLAATGTIATSTNPLQIGGDSLYGQFFQGMIDEVRIYNRALTQAEIQTDINTPIGGGGAPPPPDTTPPTVAITAPVNGSTVFNFVTVSASTSDNVGISGVQFFVDGQHLDEEVITPPFSVAWDTTSSLGSHVLTAVARDTSNNTTTSAPVSVTAVTATPVFVGQWSSPLNWPIVTVHVNLLPTGEILAWDAQQAGMNARLWNPTTNTFTSVNITTGTNIFCTGHCHLPDGRILVAGGHVGSAHVGVTDTNIFNPTTRQWTRVASMHTPRWYPTSTVLPDGRILVTAGEINCDRCNALIPEVYNPLTNTWTELLGAPLDLTYYPHMFVLPDGRVLAASTAESPIVTQALDITTQTWSVIDPTAVDGGSSAMYLPGKIMKSGTSTNPDDPVLPSEATTYVLDMTQAVVAWRETPPMVFPRTYHTLTILPDGNVLATGGGPTTNAVGVSDAIKAAELWSPVTETWTTMASMQKPRLYHSTALLLPDARVWVAGGGRFNGVNEPTDQLSSEIYSPPYLFKGTQPLIASAPVQIGYGGTMTVQTPDASRIALVSLIKLGSMTHAFNMDQRYVPLTFTAASSSLSVQTPANANLAPPGHYMLFIVDTNGVPSVATILNIQ